VLKRSNSGFLSFEGDTHQEETIREPWLQPAPFTSMEHVRCHLNYLHPSHWNGHHTLITHLTYPSVTFSPFLAYFIVYIKLVFRVKKLMGRRWGAPNSNYLLVIVSTFVMPFSITLSPSMTPGCTTRRQYECIRVLDINQDCTWTSTLIGKLAIAWHGKLKCLGALHRIEPCSYTA